MWDYLDKVDKNLLYSYALVLSGKQKQLKLSNRTEKELSEDELHKREAEDCKTTFYLVWFVYRYLLGCDTLEKALAMPTVEVLKKYHLYQRILSARTLYLGIDKDILIWKEEDMKTVLEILYKRLDFWEQLDCFIRNAGTGAKLNVRQRRAIEAKERYKALLGKKTTA